MENKFLCSFFILFSVTLFSCGGSDSVDQTKALYEIPQTIAGQPCAAKLNDDSEVLLNCGLSDVLVWSKSGKITPLPSPNVAEGEFFIVTGFAQKRKYIATHQLSRGLEVSQDTNTIVYFDGKEIKTILSNAGRPFPAHISGDGRQIIGPRPIDNDIENLEQVQFVDGKEVQVILRPDSLTGRFDVFAVNNNGDAAGQLTIGSKANTFFSFAGFLLSKGNVQLFGSPLRVDKSYLSVVGLNNQGDVIAFYASPEPVLRGFEPYSSTKGLLYSQGKQTVLNPVGVGTSVYAYSINDEKQVLLAATPDTGEPTTDYLYQEGVGYRALDDILASWAPDFEFQSLAGVELNNKGDLLAVASIKRAGESEFSFSYLLFPSTSGSAPVAVGREVKK